jgi:hypothetical protein
MNIIHTSNVSGRQVTGTWHVFEIEDADGVETFDVYVMVIDGAVGVMVVPSHREPITYEACELVAPPHAEDAELARAAVERMLAPLPPEHRRTSWQRLLEAG